MTDGLVVTLPSGSDLKLASTLRGAPAQHTAPHQAQGAASLSSWAMLRELAGNPTVYRNIRGARKLPLPYPVVLHFKQLHERRDSGPLSLKLMTINPPLQLHQPQIDVIRT